MVFFWKVQFTVFLAAGAYGVAVVHFKIPSRTRDDLVIPPVSAGVIAVGSLAN
jgi:hypothetical protein